jgi:SAM-dependent methyltransferase
MEHFLEHFEYLQDREILRGYVFGLIHSGLIIIGYYSGWSINRALKLISNGYIAGIFGAILAHVFLMEADRVLKPNGKLIMIEPANSFFGRIIYKNLHHEPFNPQGSWQIPESGPMTGANGAAPWIVFVRDREILQNEFPDLEIESILYHTPLRYLLSGGVSFKQLVPNFSYPLFSGLDNLLTSVSNGLSMFMTIKVRKKV